MNKDRGKAHPRTMSSNLFFPKQQPQSKQYNKGSDVSGIEDNLQVNQAPSLARVKPQIPINYIDIQQLDRQTEVKRRIASFFQFFNKPSSIQPKANNFPSINISFSNNQSLNKNNEYYNTYNLNLNGVTTNDNNNPKFKSDAQNIEKVGRYSKQRENRGNERVKKSENYQQSKFDQSNKNQVINMNLNSQKRKIPAAQENKVNYLNNQNLVEKYKQVQQNNKKKERVKTKHFAIFNQPQRFNYLEKGIQSQNNNKKNNNSQSNSRFNLSVVSNKNDDDYMHLAPKLVSHSQKYMQYEKINKDLQFSQQIRRQVIKYLPNIYRYWVLEMNQKELFDIYASVKNQRAFQQQQQQHYSQFIKQRQQRLIEAIRQQFGEKLQKQRQKQKNQSQKAMEKEYKYLQPCLIEQEKLANKKKNNKQAKANKSQSGRRKKAVQMKKKKKEQENSKIKVQIKRQYQTVQTVNLISDSQQESNRIYKQIQIQQLLSYKFSGKFKNDNSSVKQICPPKINNQRKQSFASRENVKKNRQSCRINIQQVRNYSYEQSKMLKNQQIQRQRYVQFQQYSLSQSPFINRSQQCHESKQKWLQEYKIEDQIERTINTRAVEQKGYKINNNVGQYIQESLSDSYSKMEGNYAQSNNRENKINRSGQESMENEAQFSRRQSEAKFRYCDKQTGGEREQIQRANKVRVVIQPFYRSKD